jgi:hypothetical protein
VRLDTRLRRPEAAVPVGCRARSDRRRSALLHIHPQNPDGTISSETDDPQPCERCGEVPEEIIEIVDVLVETHEAASPWRAGAVTLHGQQSCHGRLSSVFATYIKDFAWSSIRGPYRRR